MSKQFNTSLLINAGDMTSGINSLAFDIHGQYGFYIQAVYTGTPQGALKLQSSGDGTHWDDIGSTSVTLTGSAGSTSWNVSQAFYPLVRLVYTPSSSTGTLNASGYAKGI